MSLIGALNVGKSALTVQQAALQVTSNNIANIGNPNYTRQVARLSPSREQQLQPGIFVGTGVNLTGVQRQIDEALETRLRSSVADAQRDDVLQQWLSRIESVFNAMGEENLSTRLSSFFNSWSNLANRPQDTGLRQIVLENGRSVASWLQTTRTDLGDLQADADAQLKGLTADADRLAQQIAGLNGQIVLAEGTAGGQANALRDQRDGLLRELSELIDIQTVAGDNGMTNVYIGTEPLVFGASSRGLSVKQETVDGKLTSSIVFKSDQGTVPATGGRIGALVKIRTETTEDAISQLDELTQSLIFELNKLHASGQGTAGFSSVTGTNAVDDADAALNSEAAGLSFTPANGSFVLHVKNQNTGLTSSTLIGVDLDGIGQDMSLNDLVDVINSSSPDVRASVAGGKLKLEAVGDVEISFSQDSSGVLAALGVNSFFAGSGALDIAVNPLLLGNPRFLAAARNGEPTDNQTALAIAALESQTLTGLGGTLKDHYLEMTSQLAVSAANAKTVAEASQVILDTLQSQREALSGVSLDEEAINLMRQQRAFQGAARMIAAVDEMMKTVMQLI